MAFTSAKMGLRIWNLLTDLYDHSQLADNWAKVDYHDHSPGKGVQIPTEGIADGAITGAKVATALDPSGAYLSYANLQSIEANLAATSSGTYVVDGNTLTPYATANGEGLFYIDPAEFSVAGRTANFRLKTLAFANGVPSVSSFTVAFTNITAVAGAANTSFALTAGSNLASNVYTTPAANSIAPINSADFTIASAGLYAFTVTVSPSMSANSRLGIRSTLQVHYV